VAYPSSAIRPAGQEDTRVATNKDNLFTKFGDTWDAQYKASDDYTQKLADILKVIENNVPSDAMIRNRRLVEATKKVQRK
jgi:hypothetical protein